MDFSNTFAWGDICPPAQKSIDWFVQRELGGGKWYFIVTTHEVTEALDFDDRLFDGPYSGEDRLEIP